MAKYLSDCSAFSQCEAFSARVGAESFQGDQDRPGIVLYRRLGVTIMERLIQACLPQVVSLRTLQ